MRGDLADSLCRGARVVDLDDDTRLGTVTGIVHIDCGYVDVRWDGTRKSSTEHTDNLGAVGA